MLPHTMAQRQKTNNRTVPFLPSFEEASQNIKSELLKLFLKSGINAGEATDLTAWVISTVRDATNMHDAEEQIRGRLKKVIIQPPTDYKYSEIHIIKYFLGNLWSRTSLVARRVSGWVHGARIIDIGGGNGFIANEINRITQKNIIIADTVDYNKTGIPLCLYGGEKLPFPDGAFDTALLIAVLHHTHNPENILREAKRVAKRIIVIETVCDGKGGDAKAISFGTTAFFDWFYNGVVLESNIDISFHFCSTDGWREIFMRNDFKNIYSEDLGQMHEFLPLHHHLFILGV